MKVNGKMIRGKGTVNYSMIMEVSTKVNGLMIRNMAKER